MENLLQQTVASWETRFKQLQDQNQNLQKSNAELNQYVLNLQRSFNNQKELEVQLAQYKERLAASEQRSSQLQITIDQLDDSNES